MRSHGRVRDGGRDPENPEPGTGTPDRSRHRPRHRRAGGELKMPDHHMTKSHNSRRRVPMRGLHAVAAICAFGFLLSATPARADGFVSPSVGVDFGGNAGSTL